MGKIGLVKQDRPTSLVSELEKVSTP